MTNVRCGLTARRQGSTRCPALVIKYYLTLLSTKHKLHPAVYSMQLVMVKELSVVTLLAASVAITGGQAALTGLQEHA